MSNPEICHRVHRTGRPGLACAALTILLSAPSFAQPTNPPPAQPDDRAGAPNDGDRAPDMRDRIQRRLKELAEEQDRLKKAVEMLDAGAAPEEVMKILRPERSGDDRPEPGDGPRSPWWERRDSGDDRQGPDRPRDGDRSGRRDPAQRERVMAYMREHMPEVSARLDRLRASNPELADRVASRIGPRIGEIMDLREKEPELADLKQSELTNGLALIDAIKNCRDNKGDPDKLRAARETLAARVADQFDIRARLHGHEIDHLRERLDKLQADLNQQLSQREQTIQQRTDDMISGKEKMDLFGDGRGPGRPGRGPDDPDSHDRPDRPDRGDKPPPPPK